MTINDLIAENCTRAFKQGILAERRRAIAIAQELGQRCDCEISDELGDSLFVSDFLSYIEVDEIEL